MTELIISPSALCDLDEIWFYIGQDDIMEADRVTDEMYSAIQRLAEMPGIGHTREDLTGKDYRFWPVYTYLIV